ncbi:restriction endonuclease [Bacillus cereus]|uniref:restriction endonuclease n=1 Tax=Bacillus cereus TaxID=1396 RepID=UPI002ABEAA92|nr:restriction endonuclease [Bacillus cereus]MDZ4422075.1 hypothetical protein [Bacillus cereus]
MFKRMMPPANWQDFERLIAAIYEKKYRMPSSNLYGRHGQRQNGVDTYFKDVFSLQNQSIAIQCKLYNAGELTPDIIDAEHAKLAEFPEKIDRFLIATTDSTDTGLQSHAWGKKNPPCDIVFWDSIECDIQAYEDILKGFYSEFLIYKANVLEGNTASKFFVLECSGSRYEFLISRIPTYGEGYGDREYLLNVQNNKATNYPVNNPFDLIPIFDDNSFDAFAIYHFLERFRDHDIYTDPSIHDSFLLDTATYEKIVQCIKQYESTRDQE